MKTFFEHTQGDARRDLISYSSKSVHNILGDIIYYYIIIIVRTENVIVTGHILRSLIRKCLLHNHLGALFERKRMHNESGFLCWLAIRLGRQKTLCQHLLLLRSAMT